MEEDAEGGFDSPRGARGEHHRQHGAFAFDSAFAEEGGAEVEAEEAGGDTATGWSGAAPADVLTWRFNQVFGERAPGDEVNDADIISAIQFDSSGEQLATGDKGGRVVLFQRVDAQRTSGGAEFEYRYQTEFQSHEPEFDYLKSLEIEEKINKIRWCHQGANSAAFLLSTNDKTIKLWKVFEKKVRCVSNFNTSLEERWASGAQATVSSRPWDASGGGSGGGGGAAVGVDTARGRPTFRSAESLRLPQVTVSETTYAARCRRVFPNAHAYHINSISVNSDAQTFISSDDLRVNLWSLESSAQSFNIVDIKPANMEDLTEVITCSVFHPSHCALFAYSSSKGCVRLADMRDAALCERAAKQFEEPEPPAARSFFSEIIASISDVQFGGGGRYLVARDYLTVKVWDVAMEARPLAVLKVHEHLRGKLCDLYENDAIFDKFEACMRGGGGGGGGSDHVATGSYGHLFRVFNLASGTDVTLEASKDPHRRRLSQPLPLAAASPPPGLARIATLTRGGSDGAAVAPQPVPQPPAQAPPPQANPLMDYQQKLLHLAYHPHVDVIAAAASNSLVMFSAAAASASAAP